MELISSVCPTKLLMGPSSPTLATWIALSDELVAKVLLFFQSTSRTGPAYRIYLTTHCSSLLYLHMELLHTLWILELHSVYKAKPFSWPQHYEALAVQGKQSYLNGRRIAV